MSVAEAEPRRAQLETIEDVARRLRIHRATVYRRLQEAGVPIHKIGRSSRVRTDDVDRAFGLGVQEPEPEPEPEPPVRRLVGRPRKPPPPEPDLSIIDRALARRAAEVAEMAAELATEIENRRR